MKEKFIEWFTAGNSGYAPAIDADGKFEKEKTQHMWEAYQAGLASAEAQVKQLSMQLELSVAAERAWETTMMRVCGEDGPLSVAGKFNQLAAENAALKSMRVEGEAFENIIRMPDFTTDSMDEAAWQAYLKHCNEDDHMPFGEMYRAAVMAFRGEGFDVETPATDAILASLRAEGVEMFAERKYEEMMSLHPDTQAVGAIAAEMSSQVKHLREFAAQLRSKSEVQHG